MSKPASKTHYELHVPRRGGMIAYPSQEFASLADARVAAKRFRGYVQIHKIITKRSCIFIESVEE